MIQIIESSSAGNSAYMEWAGKRVLIDAGVGVKTVSAYLKERELSLADIDAVFITHEHSDHCKALKSFAKFGMKVYANRLTAESIRYIEPKTKELNWQIFETGRPFNVGELEVTAFSIPHDTSDAVGYSFAWKSRRVVWMTDLGKLTLSVRDIAKRANVLILESNYCPILLDNSPRPFSLKNRIKSTCGHLSNADAIELMGSLDASLIEKIFLAHVSRECNRVEHIAELLHSSIALAPIIDRIEIVSPFGKHSSLYARAES